MLESLLAEGPVDRRRLTNELASTLTPSIDVGIADLIRSSASHADEARVTLRIAAEWADFRRLWNDEWTAHHPEALSAQAKELTDSMDLVIADADELVRLEGVQALLLERRAAAQPT